MKRVFWLMACVSGPALAQSGPIDPAAQAGADAAATGDIVVTAQRRSERLQDVPLSITVANSAQLAQAGVTNVRDLTLVTPGLKVDRLGVYTQPAIRGISSQLAQPGNDANVAIYVDGVYQPNQTANTFDFADLDRVEVAKGPQGTLFGRNATGGAIQIFTRQPSFETEGNAMIGYGNLDTKTAKGFLTGPIAGDTLAASVSAFHERNDGYYRDIVSGDRTGRLNSTLLRGKLLWKPQNGIELILAGQYMRRKDGTAAVGQPFNGNTIARAINPAVLLPTRPRQTASNLDPDLDVESRAVSLTGRFDLAGGTLTSITSYSKTSVDILLDADYTALPIVSYNISQPDRNFTQELTFASAKTSGFSWVGGLFFYKDRAGWLPITINTFNGFGIQRTTAYAAFGELRYEFTDRLTAIAGLRYSHERRRVNGATVIGTNVARPNLPAQPAKNFHAFTPRFSLTYELSDATNIYGTYSQGFKSGGFTVLSPDFFRPEKVRAFEGGLKTRSGAFAFNVAGFYYDYRDMQVNTALRVNGVDLGVVTNAARSHIYGADADLSLRLSPDFSVTAGAALLHAQYEDYRNAIVQRPTGFGGNRQTATDASGNDLIRAPRFTGTVTANYGHDYDFGRIDLSGSFFYTSKFYFDSDERLTQKAYGQLNARLAWKPAGTPLEFSIWGRNLTDRDIIQSTFVLEVADGVTYAAPRTYGVTAGLSF